MHTWNLSNITCHNCGKKGHLARDCPDKVKGRSAQSSEAGNTSKHVAFHTKVTEFDKSSTNSTSIWARSSSETATSDLDNDTMPDLVTHCSQSSNSSSGSSIIINQPSAWETLADEEDEPWMEQLPLPSLPELNDGYEAGHEDQAPQVTLDFYPEIFNTTAFSATYRQHKTSSKDM